MEQSTEQEVIQNFSKTDANLSTGNDESKNNNPKNMASRIREFWKGKDVPQEKRTNATKKTIKVKEAAAENVKVIKEETSAIMEQIKTQETVSEQNPLLEDVNQTPVRAENLAGVGDKSVPLPTEETVAERNPSVEVEAKIPATVGESATFEINSAPLPEFEIVAQQNSSPTGRPLNDILGHQKSAGSTVETAFKDQHQIIVSTKKDATLSTNPAELEQRKQQSNSTSRTSLSSSGPSTSSLCHLTELAQPKPEALQTTLECLRHVNPSDTAKLENVRTHLRDLQNRPTLVTCRKSSSSNNMPQRRKTPATASTRKASKDRATFDRLASRLYEHLDSRWVNFDNFESTMPIQLGYYHAAYDALTRTCGKPYTKSSLELYQLLATELGLEAEMFVIDKTLKIDTRMHGNIEKKGENMDTPMQKVS
uniref:Uncharacterized protein n=1 Tax=Anopheles atroparvus TaxID=41427 RepID=A0AAG5DWI0_ANOAO